MEKAPHAVGELGGIDWPTARIERAEQHLVAVEARHQQISAALRQVKVVGSLADDRRSFTFAFQVPALPVLDLACEVADCIHSLRASLDALVWRLLGTHEQYLNDGERRRVRFPMTEKPSQWRDWEVEVKAWMDPVVMDRIRAVQPWHVSAGQPAQSALLALHNLDIDQKHRAGIQVAYGLTRVAVRDGEVDYDDGTDDVIDLRVDGSTSAVKWHQLVDDGGTLEPHTPLVRLDCNYSIRSCKVSFEVEVEPEIQVAGGNGPLLTWLRSLVAETRFVHQYVGGNGPEPNGGPV